LKHYYLPLRESSIGSKPIISKQDLTTIFSNIESVLNFHRKLKEGLDKLREEYPVGVDLVGQVFLQQAVHLRAYGEYIENFDAAANHVNFLKEQQGINRKKYNIHNIRRKRTFYSIIERKFSEN
jgi:hypothetical protein